MQKAKVYRNKVSIGTIKKDEQGEYSFVYYQRYLNMSHALSISVHFPLQTKPFYAKTLFPFFFNLLAEGSVKDMQCLALKIDPNDHFTRLIKTTQSNTIGAITLEEIEDEVL